MIGPRLSLMMFLEFFIWGAWYVTMGPYMFAQQAPGSLVGWAYSMGPIAAIISPFFLGMVADRFFATERVLAAMQILGGAVLCAAPAAMNVSPQAFIWVILLHMLCFMPTLGLTNTLAFHNMTNQEKQFPLIRVFGTIGWIVAGFAISLLGFDRSPNMFYVAGGAAIAMGLYSLTLPHTPAPAKGRAFSARDALGLDALDLMKNRSFAVFIISSFLICIPLAAYYALAPTFAGEAGVQNIGSTMTLGQMSEVAFMLVMPLLFVRLGVKWMLTIGMLAWVARYGLFAGAAESQAMWMVLGGIILHGICYDFFFVTGQIYVDKKSGARIRGQAQGFLVLVTQGLGMFIGAQVIGRLVDFYKADNHADLSAQASALREQAASLREQATETSAAEAASLHQQAVDLSMQATDWQMVWLIPCVFAGAVMVVFFLLFRDDGASAAVPESDFVPDPVLSASAEAKTHE